MGHVLRVCWPAPNGSHQISVDPKAPACPGLNKGALHTNHDALEFPDGEIVLLTRLYEGQKATVLTLPTQPKSVAEAEAQQRVAYVG